MDTPLLFEDVTGAIRQTAFETHQDFGCVLVELKAVQALASEHAAQLLNYLLATGLLVGLLVNFGATKLQFRRFVYETSRSGIRSAVGSR